MAAKEVMNIRKANAEPVKGIVRRRREDDSNSEGAAGRRGQQEGGSCGDEGASGVGGPEGRDLLPRKLTAGWGTGGVWMVRGMTETAKNTSFKDSRHEGLPLSMNFIVFPYLLKWVFSAYLFAEVYKSIS